MRVLHVAESFATGTMQIVLTLAERLADEGHEVAIAYGRRPSTPPDVRAVVDARIELYETPWVDRGPGSQLRAIRYLRGLVGEWRPDVVHLHSSFAGFGGVIATGRRAPIVYTPHSYSFTQYPEGSTKWRAFAAAERFVAGRVSVIGATSRDEAAQARTVARAQRVEVVHNGIEELDDPSGGLRSPSERPRVIALGRIADQRRPEQTTAILAAVSDLADVAWVGDGDDPAQVQAVRDGGVHVTGWVTREQALDELRACDVYLHWSAWDGQSVTVLEALALDAVVVASDIGPNREIVGDGRTFATQAEAIAAIRLVLTDERARAQRLRDQHELRGEFSARRMSTHYLQLYEELAASASISRP